VKDFSYVRVFQDIFERGEIREAKGINKCGRAGSGDLQQTHPGRVAVKGIRFEVHGQNLFALDFVDKIKKSFRRIN
jgi:hypothetical protein